MGEHRFETLFDLQYAHVIRCEYDTCESVSLHIAHTLAPAVGLENRSCVSKAKVCVVALDSLVLHIVLYYQTPYQIQHQGNFHLEIKTKSS